MGKRPIKQRGPIGWSTDAVRWLATRSWLFWISVGATSPLLYVLTLPPINWLANGSVSRLVAYAVWIYGLPLGLAFEYLPEPVQQAVILYDQLWYFPAESQ